jgi:nitrogen fixation NifU-like protein
MTESIRGRTREDAARLFSAFLDLVTGADAGADLGKMAAFSGLRGFPVRVKCATLAWRTLLAAFDEKAGVVSTE